MAGASSWLPDAFVYPILKLHRWQEVLKVGGVSGDEDVMSGDGLCGNDEVCVTLAGFDALLELLPS